MSEKIALIIGAGPAGLTAAYELLDTTDITPIIFESSEMVGGISRTVRYHGNRIDIGGHRFFSKSDTIMQWWLNILPMQGAPARDDRQLERTVQVADVAHRRLPGASTSETFPAPDPERTDAVMLVRNRLSRILFLRKFFDYPISLSRSTMSNLGLARMWRIGISYFTSRLFPVRHVRSLEDFFINQFGKELYETFFRDYTEKVWGVSCKEIPADWGAQRIKGLSLSKAILHAMKKMTSRKKVTEQKTVETSLIESFFYPKFGPGQLWESVAETIEGQGAHLYRNARVVGIETQGTRVLGVEVEDPETGERGQVRGDYFISTMPVRELIDCLHADVPTAVRQVAEGLQYRDFITVGVLARRLLLRNNTDYATVNGVVPDNWIYIQEPDVRVGRLQIFNNWSPYMVDNPETVWIGLEYFCNEGDELWTQSDSDFSRFAIDELTTIGVINPAEVLDTVVIRVPKAYPAYFGSYRDFQSVRDYLDRFENLFLIGRNGMHRYNNMDHSMLSAMAAVKNIRDGIASKTNIWQVNAEEDYHESK